MQPVDLYCAGDVTFAHAHGNAHVLLKAANKLATFIAPRLDRLGMALGAPKCQNLVVSPDSIVGNVYRKATVLSKTVLKDMPKNDRMLARRAAVAGCERDLPERFFSSLVAMSATV